MDCFEDGRGLEKFRIFRKDDFEADWIKLAERSFGSFGQVHRVKIKLWREQCALKSFDTTLYVTNVYRKMIEEGSKMEKVRFKYIVSIYGVCHDPPAIVMEYMSNGSLDNLLTSHMLMWPKKFQMIHEATMGMNFLHSLKPPLLHLDLKPSNILLDDHLHVKISDFGLIKWEEALNKKEFVELLTSRGNISYIPPEMFSQCSEPPGTTFDVYSFSIVMWEILTQKKPYPGSSMTTLLMKVSAGRRPCLEMIPDDKPHECDQMINIMQLCWDQNYKDRPAFSDTIRETEALSDVLKIPGGLRGYNSEDQTHRPDYTLLSPTYRKSLREMGSLSSGEGDDSTEILTLLSKRNFEGFRRTVRKGHVSHLFSDNNTLLHYTVASGDTTSVQQVLSLGAQVNSQSVQGYTPLIIAVLQRLHEVCSLLVAQKADVNQGDGDKWRALHFAAQNGDDRTVRLLLDNGAQAGVKEKAGWTPLHLATQNGHESVVRLLLKRLENGELEQREGRQGRTALHMASTYGHLDITKLLLSQGADSNVTDNSLSTPLHLVAEAGHFRVAKLLMKSGSQVEVLDHRHYRPLHLAALKGHAGICRQLLANGATPDSRTLQGWTPMHLAALRGHAATVLLLDTHRASVNAQGEEGWTPLHLACHHGQEEVVSKLLSAEAECNLMEDSGWTPLHLACNRGSFPIVLQLIAHRADVKAQNRSQATPLHLAAQQGSVPVVKALLLNGAERGVLDATGCTALTLAQRSHREEVVQLLED